MLVTTPIFEIARALKRARKFKIINELIKTGIIAPAVIAIIRFISKLIERAINKE